MRASLLDVRMLPRLRSGVRRTGQRSVAARVMRALAALAAEPAAPRRLRQRASDYCISSHRPAS